MKFIPWKSGRERVSGFIPPKLRASSVQKPVKTLEDVLSSIDGFLGPKEAGRQSFFPRLFSEGKEYGQIPDIVSMGTDAGKKIPLSSGPSEIKPGFDLADSIGSGLIAEGGIKLFGQALGELFGKKKKKKSPTTFEDLYRANLAATPKRKSYLEEAMGE